MSTRKTLCRFVAGSHLHGTSTEKSDMDYRGVFINTDPLEKYGFWRKRVTSETSTSEDLDSSMHELTHFLYLCTRTNVQILECLFTPEFVEIDGFFKHLVIENREKLLDTEGFHRSIGYYIEHQGRKIHSVYREKMVKALGHYLRLPVFAEHFFRTGVWPSDLGSLCSETFDLVMALKKGEIDPDPSIIKFAKEKIERMNESFESRTITYTPNLRYVASVLEDLYTRHS